MFSDFRKCLLCILYVISFADCKFIDDDPVYTSTDPAVREPRPCEGRLHLHDDAIIF